MPRVLLVAAAVGALTTAVLAILRPALPARLPRQLTWVASAAGAVAVGLADAAPTGAEPVDLVLRVAFGAVVPLAAANAGAVTMSWLALVATATLLLAEAPAEALTGLATGAFLALVAAGAATPAAAAISAAAAIGPLSHADWHAVTGDSAVAMAVATVPVLLAGLARTGRPVRGRITIALALTVVLLGLSAAAGLLAALSARGDVDRAVDFATAGIDRLGDDDDRAREQLLDAAGAFESAEDTLSAWWAKPALLVPGVAQQSRAVTTMASAGADLARTAADATEDADVDSIRPRDGVVDLEALAALEGPLDRSVASLVDADRRLADVETSLLLSPVAERLDKLRTEVGDALGSAELAAHAVDVAPQMLGADGPRRYFIAFQNPSELRGNGGFMGNWAEVVAAGGRLELTRSGRIRDLATLAEQVPGNPIEGEGATLAAWGPIVTQWYSVNYMPDHPTVSRFIAQLYPQSGGAPVDGVFAITPAALAGFLQLTGPIEAPGYPERLTPENAERILLHEQYLQFPQEAGEDREEFLSGVVEVLFDQLTTGELPGPRVIADELGPAVEARHLQLWSRHDDEQALFDRLGATGSVDHASTDSFGVVTQNFSANKIDWFLHRKIDHDVTWDPRTGAVEGRITVELRNDAPDEGLPRSIIGWGGDPGTGAREVPDGENYLQLNLYSRFPITELTVDGAPVELGRYQDAGHHLVRTYVGVPSESVRLVTAHIRGVVEPGGRYTVRALRQPTVNPDEITSTVRVGGGWEVGRVTGGEIGATENVAVTRENALSALEMVVDIAPAATSETWFDWLRGSR